MECGARAPGVVVQPFPSLEGTLASAPLALARWAAAGVAKEARTSAAALCHPSGCEHLLPVAPQLSSSPGEMDQEWGHLLAPANILTGKSPVVPGIPDGSASSRAGWPAGLC